MHTKMVKYLLSVLALWLPLSGWGQPGRTSKMATNLRTLRLAVDGDVSRFPVLKLNSGEILEVSFDDLTHEYRRYTYKIEHCDVEGNPTSELFESDYVYSTADEGVIEDYETSQNTTVLYTHYKFSIPNTHMRPLLSGNYRISVMTENDDDENVTVLQTYFAVVDTKVGIYPSATTNTEVDWNGTHQQIELKVDCSNLVVRDAQSEIKTLVMQNRRFDNMAKNVPFTAQNGNVLLWEHSRGLIFDAGNEYRKMEILSTRYTGMHGESVRWFDPYYHYTLQTDYPRRNYLYDEDRNGQSVVRYEGAGDADTEADYVMTHFVLNMPQLSTDQDVYVSGQWTSLGFVPQYKMHYNAANECYEANILLKCGYYNYQYLCADKSNPQVGSTRPIEGNYFQTENEYDILVYYRPAGSRYWQMVGCVTPKYKK